jgi:hypothetical protein
MNPKELANALGAEHLGTLPEIVSKLSPEQRQEAADHFGVTIWFINRCASGDTVPGDWLKLRLVQWVQRRLAN